MKELIKKHETKLRFAIVGGFNTLLDFGIFFLLGSVFNVNKQVANICSTSIAFVFSFFTNKRHTFKSSSREHIVREMILFTIVTLFGLWVIQGAIIYLLTPVIAGFGVAENLASLIAKFIATAASMVWNYLLYSRVVFKKSTPPPEK